MLPIGQDRIACEGRLFAKVRLRTLRVMIGWLCRIDRTVWRRLCVMLHCEPIGGQKNIASATAAVGFCFGSKSLKNQTLPGRAIFHESLCGQFELRDPVAHFASGNPQHQCRLGLVATGMRQNTTEQESFQLFNRLGV